MSDMPAAATATTTKTPASSEPASTSPSASGPAAAIAALQKHGGNQATAALLEGGRDAEAPKEPVGELAFSDPLMFAQLDALANSFLVAANREARATVLAYLRKGLGIGGAPFWRSSEVRAFRQQLKDAARRRAAEDIAMINASGTQGPATRQYLDVLARSEAYGMAKESVEAELDDEADQWMQQNWDARNEAEKTAPLAEMRKAMWTILAPAPADPKLIQRATEVGTALAKTAAEARATRIQAAARAWKNEFIKPDLDDAAGVAAAERTKDALAEKVGERAHTDEIGRKSLEKAIKANTTDEGMGIVGKMLDQVIPRAGDTVELSIEIKIPIPESPAFVTITLEGKAGRGITGFTTSGVTTLGDPKRLEIMAQLSVGAGVGAELLGLNLGASGSVGFFVRAGSDDGTYATMKSLSYGAYRSACGISRQFGNWWAGSGNGADEGKTQRSEIWAAMVEEQVFADEGRNAFADVGGAGSLGAEVGVGKEGSGGGGKGSVELAGELFKRYDHKALKESLGEDTFAMPVASKAAAQARREKAAGRLTKSMALSTEVAATIVDQDVTFAASFSGEHADPKSADDRAAHRELTDNWGVEISAALGLGTEAGSAVDTIAVGLVAGALAAAKSIGDMVEKKKIVKASAADMVADMTRLVNAGLNNELSEAIGAALTSGEDSAIAPASELQAAITFGRTGGNRVVRFELRESKSVEVNISAVNAGVKISAKRGKRIFAAGLEEKTGDDPATTSFEPQLEVLGFRPLE